MLAPVRFHALLIVRDEGDIIAQTLDHLLGWGDALYVYDTGSHDETWEIVRERAARDDRLVLMGCQPVVFHAGVRAMLFERYRGRFEPGDWIARVDADEFYDIVPPEFVRQRVKPFEQLVCGQLYDFVLLRREAKAWEQGRDDRSQPIEDRRRHYIINDYPEIRLFRYRRSLRWPASHQVPMNLGPVARARIPIRHYRWRDPHQARQRWALRMAMQTIMPIGGTHWNIPRWQDRLRRTDDPLVFHWPKGQPLPTITDDRRVESPSRRFMLRLRQRLGLVALFDRLAPGFDPDWQPDPLPPSISQEIERRLNEPTGELES